MTKRIIVLSDGTGNAAANLWRTNVWRMFDALDLTDADQVAAYDDGVGTSSFKPMAILGGAFGWGLKRNVLNLYKYVCRNYSADAEIYGFGFSRGAFTIRVLNGLILNQGLVAAKSESELNRLAKAAYREYRAEKFNSLWQIEKPFRAARNFVLNLYDRARRLPVYEHGKNIQVENIRFLGLWDTVAAYGLPIDEMTRGVSRYLWPLELPDRVLSSRVQRACHALALDDERTTFHPILWTEEYETAAAKTAATTSEERISQVWFAGVHTNVGGGYPDDRLAYIPLYWMMKEAALCGLKFKNGLDSKPDVEPEAMRHVKLGRDKDGRLYDSRKGLGGYYRYGPRRLDDLCNPKLPVKDPDHVQIDLPKVHASALQRIRGDNVYGPTGIGARYAVVDGDDNRILRGNDNKIESPEQASARDVAQEHVRDLIWQRRFVYFLTLAASFHLVLFPLIWQTVKAAEFDTKIRFVSETIRFAGSFLPAMFAFWISAFAASPWTFLIGVACVAGFIIWSTMLAGQITDTMRRIWLDGPVTAPAPSGVVYLLRTHPAYQRFIRAMKRKIIPVASVFVLLYVGLAIYSHLAFNIADSAGAFCHEVKGKSLLDVPVAAEISAPDMFSTRKLCWASGIKVEPGVRYSFRIERGERWMDKTIPADLGGFDVSEVPGFWSRIAMTVAVPFRRVIMRPWFLPILRVGGSGTDEYFVDPPGPVASPDIDTRTSGVFRARREGELFLYVNDAALAIPGLQKIFYNNNKGTATLSIRRTAQQ